MKVFWLVCGLFTLCVPEPLWAQDTSTEETTSEEEDADAPPGPSTGGKQNAVYARPFVVGGQMAAVGGYAEANLNYSGEEGVNEGPGFEFRRFNIFIYSAIGSRLRLISELEFEHGTEEIALETALLDFEIFPELVLRMGILLTPLGAFNQAHDGPIWDFVERPLVSTTIIPSTFSEVGLGAHGSVLVGPLDLDYQLYATQGLADGVLDNPEGRTSIPNGRAASLFAEDNNGIPAVTGRVALRYDVLAELGLSGYHGAYNTFELEGEEVDAMRTLTLGAVDWSVSTEWFEVRGEAALAFVEVPASLRTALGSWQWGLHVDAIVPVWQPSFWGYDATLNLGLRFEHVDYHASTLENGDVAGRETTRLTGSVAFRPGQEAVFRLNYAYLWNTDLVGNPSQGALLQFGAATYF